MNRTCASSICLMWGLSLALMGPSPLASGASNDMVAPSKVAPAKNAPSSTAAKIHELKSLAASDTFDELYLAGSALKPEAFSSGDRVELGSVFLSGAQKISGSDGVLAFGLAELSLKFSETLDGLSTASDLALALGETSLAATYLDRARQKDPSSDGLKLKQGALAEFSKDWTAALAAYSEVQSGSDDYEIAQVALVRVAESQKAEDAAAMERAKRDFEKRLDATDGMIAAMPVSEFDLCRAHTLAACEAVTACRKSQANCTFLLESCPTSRRQVNIARSKLSKCAVALAALPCDKVESAIPDLSSGVCFGLLLRTSKELVPSDGSASTAQKHDEIGSQTDDSSQVKQPSDKELQRILEQLRQQGF